MLAQGVKLVIQLASIAILARLLAPSDFGLVAMVTVFTGLAMQLTDGGLSAATVQQDIVTHGQVSNLFWVNGLLGTMLCLFCVVISPVVAMLYGETRVSEIMAVMSFVFIISGFSVQHKALLVREMRFKAISAIEIVSMAVGLVACIVAAISDMKYWALVIGPIAQASTASVLRWFNVRWVPGWMHRGSGVRPMLSFGKDVTAANFIGYFTNNAPPFFIGYIAGPQWLGLFNRSNALTSVPSNQLLPPIISVLQPTVARIANDPEKLKKSICSLMSKVAILSTLITVTMALFAEWIVLLFLGPAWGEAVIIFRFLAIYSFIQPLTGLLAVALVAKGETKAMMNSKIHSFFLTVSSLLVGGVWGGEGIVLAFALSGLLVRLPVFFWYSSKFLPLSMLEMTKPVITSLLCVVATVGVMLPMKEWIDFGDALPNLLFFTPVCILVYLGCCLLIKATRVELIDLVSSIRSVLKLKIGAAGRR